MATVVLQNSRIVYSGNCLEWVRRIARQKIRLELGVKTPPIADNATE
jgi:hypothetical protein